LTVFVIGMYCMIFLSLNVGVISQDYV
jgi:hypothetical protein